MLTSQAIIATSDVKLVVVIEININKRHYKIDNTKGKTRNSEKIKQSLL